MTSRGSVNLVLILVCSCAACGTIARQMHNVAVSSRVHASEDPISGEPYLLAENTSASGASDASASAASDASAFADLNASAPGDRIRRVLSRTAKYSMASMASTPIVLAFGGLVIVMLLVLSCIFVTELQSTEGRRSFQSQKSFAKSRGEQTPTLLHSSSFLPTNAARDIGAIERQQSFERQMDNSRSSLIMGDSRSSLIMGASRSSLIMGDAPSGQSGHSGHSQSSRVTPLCSELVMESCETWFCISFRDLENTAQNAQFEVLGFTGKPMLKASRSLGSDGISRISLALKSSQLASISSPPKGQRPAVMQIKGRGGRHYGEMRLIGNMVFGVFVGENEAMRIKFDPNFGHITVTSSSGAVLGSASRCTESEFFKDAEFLEVKVCAGVDGVLALACVVGIVVFGSAPFSCF